MWLTLSNEGDVQDLQHLHLLVTQSLLRHRHRLACAFA